MPQREITMALLPFENLSDSPEDSRLAKGLAQDLIVELARFPTIAVIAADSTFSQAANSGEPSCIGRRLGVEYLLQGSFRRAGATLRISAQVMQLEGQRLLWADRFTVPVEEVFALQDEIIARIANALAVRIDQEVWRAARRRPLASLAAYECWLCGMERLQQGTLESDQEARRYFERALEVDGQFARAWCGLSLSHFNEWSCQAWKLWEEKEELAYRCAQQAENMDPQDQMVQVILGRIEQYRREFDRAATRFARAISLAPNDAHALIQLAPGYAYQGELELSGKLGARALQLNPYGPGWYFYFAGLPLFAQQRYGELIEMFGRAPLPMVDAPAYLACAHAHLGNRDRARACLEIFKKEFVRRITYGREPGPGEAMAWIRHVNPFRREADLFHLIRGLEMAGLAERGPRTEVGEPVHWPVANIFRREGELWTAAFDHKVAQLMPRRGFQDIAHLLAHPHEECHCLTLYGAPAQADPGAEVLDGKTRQAYQGRLREIEADLRKAEQDNALGLTEQLQEEKSRLLEEITRTIGLGGRSRRLGDPAERARTAVTWRIRDAIKNLGAAHPALARHLSNSIRTGVFCSYTPEQAIRWHV